MGSNETEHTVNRIRCVLVDDSGVGKTSLLSSYMVNGFPREHIPSAFNSYSGELSVTCP